MKRIYAILTLAVCAFQAFAQQSDLLEMYRRMALDYNHDLKAAEKNISASMELEKSARADLKPKLSGAANFQHVGKPLEIYREVDFLDNPLHFEARDLKYGASLTLMQPLYTGGKLKESIRLAQHQHSLATHQTEAFRSAVYYQTDLQYWHTVAQQEVVEVVADYRDAIASLVNIISERVEVGLIDPQDLLMAEVKLNDADYQLLQARSIFETKRMALNSWIGAELHLPTVIDTEVPQITSADLLVMDGCERPEIKMATDQIHINQSIKKLTDSQFKPQLYVGLDGTYSSPGHDFRPELDPNYAVYAKLSVPIFEWGKRRNEKRASSLKVQMATDNLNKVEDSVNLEVQTARVSLNQAMERVQLTESSLEKAFENERKAVERYMEGRVSVVEVIEAQTYRQTSQINHVQAKVMAQGHYSELIKALNRYDYP